MSSEHFHANIMTAANAKATAPKRAPIAGAPLALVDPVGFALPVGVDGEPPTLGVCVAVPVTGAEESGAIVAACTTVKKSRDVENRYEPLRRAGHFDR
jgi:hypothetical protein